MFTLSIEISGGGFALTGDRISERTPTDWESNRREWHRTADSKYPGAPAYALALGHQWAAWHHNRPLGYASLTTSGLIVPCWAVFLFLAICPAMWLWKGRGPPPARDGIACPHCGYDLRASSGRCPDCGTTVPDPRPRAVTDTLLEAPIELLDEARRRVAEMRVPFAVAVNGTLVNGGPDAERSDVAAFIGKSKGVIYVRGESVATVIGDEVLERLIAEVRKLAGTWPADRRGSIMISKPRLAALRNLWVGFCGGILLGIFVGVEIPRGPQASFLVLPICGAILFLSALPDSAAQIARGVRRWRFIARRREQ